MHLPKRNKNKQHIRHFPSIVSTSGLGLFLIMGLTGCSNNDNDCNKNGLYDKKDDCNKNINSFAGGGTTNTSSNHSSSGFFAPIVKGSSSSGSHSSFSSGG